MGWAAFFLALKWIGGFEHDVLDSLPHTYIAAFSKCGHGALMHFLLRDESPHDYSTKVAVTRPFWSGRKWSRRMVGLLVSGTGA